MNKILKLITKSKRVALIAHISPDPDCMGSITALSSILRRMGKQASVFVDTKTMSEYFSCFNLPENISAELKPEEFDTIIAVDTSSIKQLGKYGQVFKNFSNTGIIDHHKIGDLTAKASFIDSSRSSCSEIIYDISKELGITLETKEAEYIFAGIVGDTNCFQNDNVNSKTFDTASKICELGADTGKIIFEVFKHTTNKDIAVKRLVYENMQTEEDIGYFVFTRKMQKEIGTDDLGNLVNEILNNENNKIAFIIKQKEKNVYTVSLRCKYKYDVSKIANKFGGGGHKQASGIMFIGSPMKHLKQILTACKQEIAEIDSNNE